MMKEVCPDCDTTDKTVLTKANHKGLYCTNCGHWFKWLNKKEYNLYLISKGGS